MARRRPDARLAEHRKHHYESPQVDIATIVGVLLAALALLGTNSLDGGHLTALLQPTAALVVLGGTAGAVAIPFPGTTIAHTFRELLGLVRRQPAAAVREETIQLFVAMAGHAQKRGVRILAGVAETLGDEDERDHMRRALMLVARQTPADAVRDALELELDRAERDGERAVRVLSSAGGYAPTMGILGAVLGLIHVMNNISDPSRLGTGIAVAFVATVYGLATANLLLLPLAGRMRERFEHRVDDMELVLEGACALCEGADPSVVEYKLSAFGRRPRARAT
ncbi:MAG: MotA/TolQ/ExbB proton channel family protein, partial [Nannocystaceae bacterium]|nr:MotA/TolQ/ExbB proton channel family protein [Nannocystaceae bacterium]